MSPSIDARRARRPSRDLMSHVVSDIDDLLQRAACGDNQARSELFQSQSGMLTRFVKSRMDPTLSARVDPTDVVQDVLMEASKRLESYLATRPVPFTNWLLKIANDAVIDTYRRHTSQGRDVDREVHPAAATDSGISGGWGAEPASQSKSPSSFVGRKELKEKVHALIATLPESDGVIIHLRFIEQLSIREIADRLGITEDAARMRQLRAVEKLRQLLAFDF